MAASTVREGFSASVSIPTWIWRSSLHITSHHVTSRHITSRHVTSHFPLPLDTIQIRDSTPSLPRGTESQVCQAAPAPLSSHRCALHPPAPPPSPPVRGTTSQRSFLGRGGSAESTATLSKHQRGFDQRGSAEHRSPRGALQVRRQHWGHGTLIFCTVTRENLFEE